MKLIKSEKGMSLVEVLIASAISIGIAVSFLNISDNQLKALKNVEARYDILENINSIRKVLANSENCSESFRGLNPSVSPSLSDLMEKDMVTGVFNPRFPINKIFGIARVEIIDYKLSPSPVNINEMFLNIEYSFAGGTMKNLNRKIALNVWPNNSNNITECSYSGSETPVISKGPIAELHHVHGAPGNDFRSTTVSASCPAGLKAINCLACAVPSCIPNATTFIMDTEFRANVQIELGLSADQLACNLTFNAQFPESNFQYLRWADHKMSVQPICTNI